MTQLTFAKKMVLSILSFTIPIVFLSYLMFQVQTKDIDFALQEKKGAEYQRPVIEILGNLALHGFATQRAALGDAGYKSKTEPLVQELDKYFKELQRLDNQMGVDLEFTIEGLHKRGRRDANVTFLSKNWEALKSGLSGMSAEQREQAHARLLDELMKMNSHLGDTSNLILDPDLDSYYIMDLILLALPQTQERFSRFLVFASSLMSKSSVSQDERIQLAVFASQFREADLKRIETSVKTAISEDDHFYGVSDGLKKDVRPQLDTYKSVFEGFLLKLERVASSGATAGDLESLAESAVNTVNEGQKMFEVSSSQMASLLDARLSSLYRQRTLNLSLSLLVLALSCTFASWISFTTNRALKELNRSLIESEEKIRMSSEQMNQAGMRLSESSTESAASLEETVASLEELSSMVKRTSEHSQEAARLSNAANTFAAKGEEEMGSLTQAMAGISEASKRVEQITAVIDDIAFQTNLLALNASVEAARAGEQGKGFAVVAEAVRNLAQRSAASAKDITTLIKDTVGKVDAGSKTAERSRSVLLEIVTSIRRISEISNEIASSNVEQTSGIEQINKAMNQLDQVGQTNAAQAEEIAGTSEALLGESRAMQTHVEKLIVMVGKD